VAGDAKIFDFLAIAKRAAAVSALLRLRACVAGSWMRMKPTSLVWLPPPPRTTHFLPQAKQTSNRAALEAKRSHTRCGPTQVSHSFINGRSEVHTGQRWQKQNKSTQSIKRGAGGGGGHRLHSAPEAVPRSMMSCVFVCRRFDCISCSVRSLVMPHSATSSANGDDISTTVTWNSGV